MVPDAPPVPSSQLIPDGGELVLQGPSSDLATLGLGGWWPPGIFQQFLDLVHSTGIPWWASIAIGKILYFLWTSRQYRVTDY